MTTLSPERSLYELLMSVIALAGVPEVTILVLRFRRSSDERSRHDRAFPQRGWLDPVNA